MYWFKTINTIFHWSVASVEGILLEWARVAEPGWSTVAWPPIRGGWQAS